MLSFSSVHHAEHGEGASKKGLLVLIAAALGILLILFGTEYEKREKEAKADDNAAGESELCLYQTQLEAKLKGLCESVSGVSEVTVIVTLESGFESVYATEEENGNEQYVVIGSGSAAQALLLSRRAPAIAGIGIVCAGGEDVSVSRELTELISAALHISSNRIHISAAK